MAARPKPKLISLLLVFVAFAKQEHLWWKRKQKLRMMTEKEQKA